MVQESNAQHATDRQRLEAELEEKQQQLDAANKALGAIGHPPGPMIPPPPVSTRTNAAMVEFERRAVIHQSSEPKAPKEKAGIWTFRRPGVDRVAWCG